MDVKGFSANNLSHRASGTTRCHSQSVRNLPPQTLIYSLLSLGAKDFSANNLSHQTSGSTRYPSQWTHIVSSVLEISFLCFMDVKGFNVTIISIPLLIFLTLPNVTAIQLLYVLCSKSASPYTDIIISTPLIRFLAIPDVIASQHILSCSKSPFSGCKRFQCDNNLDPSPQTSGTTQCRSPADVPNWYSAPPMSLGWPNII